MKFRCHTVEPVPDRLCAQSSDRVSWCFVAVLKPLTLSLQPTDVAV
jgi:hypothetical protein